MITFRVFSPRREQFADHSFFFFVVRSEVYQISPTGTHACISLLYPMLTAFFAPSRRPVSVCVCLCVCVFVSCGRRFGDLQDVVDAGRTVQVELEKALPNGEQSPIETSSLVYWYWYWYWCETSEGDFCCSQPTSQGCFGLLRGVEFIAAPRSYSVSKMLECLFCLLSSNQNLAPVFWYPRMLFEPACPTPPRDPYLPASYANDQRSMILPRDLCCSDIFTCACQFSPGRCFFPCIS